jgi:hypothetical protein
MLERTVAASLAGGDVAAQRRLAGAGSTATRADEVAAAAIRYPLGLAAALEKCAQRPVVANSFFASATYGDNRWVWFDLFADGASSEIRDVDDVRVRAGALAEW